MVPGKVGIGITTRNRPELLEEALGHHLSFPPPEPYEMVLVDDGSDNPVCPEGVWTIQNNGSLGIAAAKNQCIEFLMRKGCEHLFLFDDDAWCVSDGWWEPYIKSPEPHLAACFAHNTSQSTPLWEIYRSPDLVAYHTSRGYMLYFHRSVIEKVGGMDTNFKLGYEHVEHSNRIHNAGLTLFAHQDIPDSSKLIYSADSEHVPVASTITPVERRMVVAANLEYLERCRGRTTFVPYHTLHNLVLTCLFTSQVDPQRKVKWEPDVLMTRPLTVSLNRFKVDYRVFHDELEEPSPAHHFIQTTCYKDAYRQRWISYRQYLLQHPEIRWIWACDATDVEFLRDPFEDMKPGIIYSGWENAVVGCEWMRGHHSDPEWIERNKDRMLLNPGVVGADRVTFLMLCDRIIENYTYAAQQRKEDELGDMLHYNKAVYSFAPNIITGPAITTVYKCFERNNWSIARHK